MQLMMPAEAEEIRRARRIVGAWATQIGLPTATVADLVLATHEALANAVDHAYLTGAGPVSVTAECTEGDVLIAVSDQGRWRPRRPVDGRGRGLLLIRHLADHVDISHGDSGTTVRMTWRSALKPHASSPVDARPQSP
jgi:serine/threonine-protein kinase RsbW